MNDKNITVIPENTEKYISFSKQVSKRMHLRFIDSFRFMASSLDTLARNLLPGEFHTLNRFFSFSQVPLLLRKGVYPYDYISHVERFKETTLPKKEDFFNKLNQAPISDDDYNHAKQIWNTFNIKNLGEYSDLYVKSDVLLLTDIFENFRNVCMKNYNLDPAWYYTAPGLSWDAMLKKTKVRLELLTDYDMLLFVENGIRGGISQCSHRYGIANNKYLTHYDESRASNFLIYLDANNLYGGAMSQPLPLKNFKWIEPTSATVESILNAPDDSSFGYILEVDLEYPVDIHDNHSDLPLAPETIKLPNTTENRLLTTLYDKHKYVIHYRNLKLYLNLGIKLAKVHRVLKFNQTPWLKDYIDLNTKLRAEASSDFHKSFFKLMNNAVFGKTMENIRKRVDIKLVTNEKKAEKWISRTNFVDRTIFSHQLVAIHLRRTHFKFNKPIAVGMAVLDISKTLMYDFHYSKMVEKYGRNLKLLYTDTDSFIYNIITDDIYDDIKVNLNVYDTSDYAKDNIYGIPLVNKKVLGKMKDENKGCIMTEFIGLRSKMYAFKVNEDVTKKLKGVKKCVVEGSINFEDYKRCLFDHHQKSVNMNGIRSKRHELTSVTINKLALSPYDQKRYVLEDNVTTLPHGHY